MIFHLQTLFKTSPIPNDVFTSQIDKKNVYFLIKQRIII